MFSTKQLIALGVLSALLVLETALPFYSHNAASRSRLRHDALNFAWGIVNALLGAAFVATLLASVDTYAAARNIGLLRAIPLPPIIEWGLALLLFDLWMYVWHRLNHQLPFLWRFHRMHHSDRAMDASTGVRFHTGEILLSGLARLLVLPLLGMSIAQLIVYESILLPVIFFHHSNVRLPRWLDFGLAYLVVSPAVHRVHHSRIREETNSNYGSVLPWWDWLFGSLCIRRDTEAIELGLDEFRGNASETLTGMATTPLADAPPNAKQAANSGSE